MHAYLILALVEDGASNPCKSVRPQVEAKSKKWHGGGRYSNGTVHHFIGYLFIIKVKSFNCSRIL
jgi:hypothetical protein